MWVFIAFFWSLPFDWKTPLGYLFVLVVESMATFCTCLYLTASLCFYIGSTWMLKSFVEDAANGFSHLNEAETSHRNSKKMKTHFNDIVQLYADAKELSEWQIHQLFQIHLNLMWNTFRCVNEFSDIYEFIILGIFLWCTTTICSSLLVLQAEIVEYIFYWIAKIFQTFLTWS